MRFADVEVEMEFTTGGLRYRKVSTTDAVQVVRVKTPEGAVVPVAVVPADAAPAAPVPPDKQVDFVLLSKEPDDPKGLKASVGGTDDTGFYCVFRGDRAAVANMLEKVVKDLREGL